MSLLDILSGNISHFNKTAVPVLNNIWYKIDELQDINKKRIFTICLGNSQKCVDMFFKPGIGPVIKDVKLYAKSDFEKIFSLFFVWYFIDFYMFGLIDINDKKIMEQIIPVSQEVSSNYFENLNHNTLDISAKMENLWNSVCEIITTMPNTEENIIIFKRDFSRINKEMWESLNL